MRRAGHDASTVVEEHLGGSLDSEIAAICRREVRALLTLDTDFADIRAYPPDQFHGLIVLRLKSQAKPDVLRTLSRLVALFRSESPDRRLWIVEEDRIRVRD